MKLMFQTYIGPMVVSVNPFQPLPIYDAERLKEYKGAQRDSMPPHLFAVANSVTHLSYQI